MNQVPKHWLNFTKHPHQSRNHSASEVTLTDGKTKQVSTWRTEIHHHHHHQQGKGVWRGGSPGPHLTGGRGGGEGPRTRTLLWCLSLPSITITALCVRLSAASHSYNTFCHMSQTSNMLEAVSYVFFRFLQNQEHQQVNNTLSNSNYRNTTCETQSHNITILGNQTFALIMQYAKLL